MEINLKKFKESGLFVEEFLYLCMINEGENILDYSWSAGSSVKVDLELLEANLWIKSTEDGYVLREKGRKLFEDSKDLYTFDQFWDEYHRITKLPKSDKDAALKYWKRLKGKERVLAYENISNYYNSLNDKKYCRKARTYLDNKNFNDEFKQSSESRIIAR